MRWLSKVTAAGAVLALLVSSAPALAAFPGANGQIVFTEVSSLKTIFPDGTGSRLIGTGSQAAWSADGDRVAYMNAEQVFLARADGSQATLVANGRGPAWSPDGTKVAYSRSGDIFVTNVFTGGEIALTSGTNSDVHPAWSPDGTKIAFGRDLFAATDGDVWVMNADGTNQVNLTGATSTVDDSAPNWSPDGSRIVHVRGLQGPTDEIYVMNADGTGATALTANSVFDGDPAWSPDGTKIVFEQGGPADAPDLWLMDPDGSSVAPLTAPGQPAGSADWQPLVSTGYPRPKGASPVRVSLVPAYASCFVSNRAHGPPLAFPSCNPPGQQSSTLTVGTPDANGAPANATAAVRLATLVGDPATPADEADVEVQVSVSDVRCAASNAACPDGALSDFAGQVLLTVTIRVTDRLNGSPAAGTVADLPVRVPVTCASTPDPDIGSTCVLATTVDSVVPGAAPEGGRSIWQTGELEVWDPGPNGTGYAACPPTCGNGDEAVFMRQGIFVP